MDYEKAYKAVLQTAKQWIKDGCTDKEKICLECVFPELRESEDERIRRTLVEYFGPKVQLDFVRGIPIQKIRDWLDKQKEQKQTDLPAGFYYIDLNGNRYYSKEFRYGDMKLKVGEQKPLETPSPSVIYTEQGDVLAEQEPAWSEEDEKIRKLLIWQVHRNIEDETNDLAQSVYDGIKGHDPDLEESIEDWKKCLAWLKSIPLSCPKSSDNWKPSEEQLNALNFAITYFIHDTNYKNPTELRELYDELLKLK